LFCCSTDDVCDLIENVIHPVKVDKSLKSTANRNDAVNVTRNFAENRLLATKPINSSIEQKSLPIELLLIMGRLFLLAALLLAPTASLDGPTTAERSPITSSQVNPPSFSDITALTGIEFKHEASHTSQKYFIETMGSGVAVFDYDSDALLDIFLVNGAALQDPMGPAKEPDKSDRRYWNRLYRNNGNLTFTDVTEKAGVQGRFYGMGVAAGDYDNDGHPDLYVTNFGANLLYHNNGDGTFADVTQKGGVAGGGWSSSSCFVDYDRDGKLDLIVARYVEWDFVHNPWCGQHKPGYRSYCHPDHFSRIHSLVYHNNGDGTFTDVSAKAGFADKPGKALGLSFNDFDRDGWLDILVANDEVPQQLFRNNQDGTFTEIATLQGVAHDEDGRYFAGMGVDFQDYNNDGWPDAFINALSSQKYALYANNKTSFDYVSGPSGVAGLTLAYSGWGARFLDYDNDGWKDLFVAQGHVMDNIELTHPSYRYLQPLLLMRNVNGKFRDASKQGGPAFEIRRAGRGAAFGDLDNDGNLDVVINCNEQAAVVLHNQGSSRNNWLLVDTSGTRSNRDGTGAQLRLVTDSGLEQNGLVSGAGSYLSASDKRVHFGLGPDKFVRLLEITWPSGVVQRLEKIAANQVLKVQEPSGRNPSQSARRRKE
jgi:hypothetical protein